MTWIKANHGARNSTETVPFACKKARKIKKQESKEVTMTTIASTRRSDYGMTCVQCGDLLIAPEWSEYEDERHVLNLWSCSKCGCRFETDAFVPADAQSVSDDVSIRAFFPSLLVA
ncbi:MAG: hypothetical protein WAL03_00725 [Pseudolabrys sp.]